MSKPFHTIMRIVYAILCVCRFCLCIIFIAVDNDEELCVIALWTCIGFATVTKDLYTCIGFATLAVKDLCRMSSFFELHLKLALSLPKYCATISGDPQ